MYSLTYSKRKTYILNNHGMNYINYPITETDKVNDKWENKVFI